MNDFNVMKEYIDIHGDEKLVVTLSFVNVIALKIGYQETYKIITYTKDMCKTDYLIK